MSVFRSYWATLVVAIADKRHLVEGIIGLAIWAFHWIGTSLGFPYVNNIQNWHVGAVVVVFLLLWWLLSYATELRLKAQPKLRLIFDSINNKPEYISANDSGGAIGPLRLGYIVGLVNDGSSYLTNCKIGLVIHSSLDIRPLSEGPIYLSKPFTLTPGEPIQFKILTAHVDLPDKPAEIFWFREENGMWMMNPIPLSLVADSYDISVRAHCSESRPAELLLKLSKTENGGWKMNETKRTKDHPIAWFDRSGEFGG